MNGSYALDKGIQKGVIGEQNHRLTRFHLIKFGDGNLKSRLNGDQYGIPVLNIWEDSFVSVFFKVKYRTNRIKGKQDHFHIHEKELEYIKEFDEEKDIEYATFYLQCYEYSMLEIFNMFF